MLNESIKMALQGMVSNKLRTFLTLLGIIIGVGAVIAMVSLGFGIGVVPQIVLDNSPLTAHIRIYDIQPPLTAYDIGLFALEKRLKDPLINAFWNRQG